MSNLPTLIASSASIVSDELKSLKDDDIVRYMQGGISDGQKQRYFSEISRRYSSRVFARCLSMLRDEEDAKDASQEIFIKILEKIDQFKSEAKLSTWIYSISYNYCIDFIRRRKKQQYTISMEEVMPSAHKRYIESEGDIPHAVLQEKRALMVKEVLNLISKEDKEILIMRYYSGLTIKEVAKVLGIWIGAVKMRTMRAKESVNDKWIEIYWEEERFEPRPLEGDEEFDPREWEDLGATYAKELAGAVST